MYETRNHLHEYRNKLKSLVKKGITSSANDNIFLAETREVRSGEKYIYFTVYYDLLYQREFAKQVRGQFLCGFILGDPR